MKNRGPALSPSATLRVNERRESKGFAAIYTVLIIAAVVVSVALTVTYLSIGEAQSSLVLFKGEDNLNFVEGCVEDYLLKIRADSSFTAKTITRPDGRICHINITAGNPNWNITVSEQVPVAYQRNIQVIFVRNATGITLTSWKEI